MADFVIRVIVDPGPAQDGAKKTEDALAKTERRGVSAGQAISRAFALIGGVFVIRRLQAMADEFTSLQNRLRVVTGSTEELGVVTDELFAIANRTRQEVGATAQIYQRLSLAADELGISQQEALRFTESLNKVVAASGVTAEEARGGLIQFSQGLASGTLRGDELRSVMEQLPAVARIVAKEMGISIGELRKVAAEGKVTTDVIIDAFENAQGEIDGMFSKTIPTIGQSLTILRNNFVRFIGDVDSGNGITRTFVKVITFLGENLVTLGKAAAVAGSMIAVVLVQRGIMKAVAAVRLLTLAIAANPLGALVLVLTGAVAAVIEFGDRVKIASDSTATLRDVAVNLFRTLKKNIEVVVGAIKIAFEDLLESISPVFKGIDIGLKESLVFMGAFVDSGIKLFVLLKDAIVFTFGAIPAVIAEVVIKALNFLVEVVEKTINGISGALNKVADFIPGVGANAIGSVSIGRVSNPFEGAIDSLGGFIDDAVEKLVEVGPVQEAIESALDTALKNATGKAAEEIRKVGGGAGRGRGKGGGLSSEEIADRLGALEKLRASLNPIVAAQQELAETENILREAQAARLITDAQAVKLLDRKKELLKAQLDPFSEQVRLLEQETAFLGMGDREREKAILLLELENKLRDAQGGVILPKQTAELERQVDALFRAKDAQEARSKAAEEARRQQEQAIEAQRRLSEQLQKMLSPEQGIADAITETGAAFNKFFADADFGVNQLSQSLDRMFQRLAQEMLRIIALEAISSIFGNKAATGATGQASAGAIAGVIGGIFAGGFAHGGSFAVPGHGGTDSQLVAFRATPGERVDVSTPRQQMQQQAPAAPQNIRLINVMSHEEMVAAMGSGAGERIIINAISRNPDQIRRLLR